MFNRALASIAAPFGRWRQLRVFLPALIPCREKFLLALHLIVRGREKYAYIERERETKRKR